MNPPLFVFCECPILFIVFGLSGPNFDLSIPNGERGIRSQDNHDIGNTHRVPNDPVSIEHKSVFTNKSSKILLGRIIHLLFSARIHTNDLRIMSLLL